MANARDYATAAGSSTVHPFASAAAERVARDTEFKAPLIEALGSGGGIRAFCAGVGVEYPDIALASRAMTAAEMASCRKNGVVDATGIQFGYDGIAIATSRKAPHLDLTLRHLYLALARVVPHPNEPGRVVPNPYRTWRDIHEDLPAVAIRIYGPPSTSGTRDVLTGGVMVQGCRSFAQLRAMEKSEPERFRILCQTIREDGVYVDAGENDNLIVRKLTLSDTAAGIFGFSFFDQNRDLVQAALIERVAPSYESIYAREYPLSRPLYLYVKQSHLKHIPGLEAFLREMVSPGAVGEEGYLVDKGLIPLPPEERERNAAEVARLITGIH
ncbi:MAG: substrate-binding domain-containing protein [Pseudomonadota bacterium]